MSEPTVTTDPASSDRSIRHMEEEFAELEAKARPHWGRTLLVVLLIAGAAGAVYYWLQQGRAERASNVPIVGVAIGVRQPTSGSVHDDLPTFAWESVPGRHDYNFRVQREDSAIPLVERNLTATSVSLAEEESGRLAPGNYVWIVRARSRDGGIIGTGSGKFRLR